MGINFLYFRCYNSYVNKIILFLTIPFIIFSCEQASFIEDYKIEGIGYKDSLLNYFSEDEIKAQIKKHKYMYAHLNDDFGEVYKYDNLKTYEYMTFFVKPDDKKYLIYAITGNIEYKENIEGCYKKQNEIVEDFSKTYKNARMREDFIIFPYEPNDKSFQKQISFIFDSGDRVTVNCTDFEESLRLKNNWGEGLAVTIQSDELSAWYATSNK